MTMAGMTHIFILVMFSLTWVESHLRQKRAWIVDSFAIEEEHPGPFPYRLGRIHVERKYRVDFKLHGSGVDEAPIGLLSIDQETGIVMVNRKIDYEQYKQLKLAFVARNSSDQEIDTKLGVEITILDVNDNPPQFQRDVYETTITEAAMQGSYVMTVLAHDDDKPDTVNSTFDYRIIAVTPNTSNAKFFIKDNGAILFKGCLNYDLAQKYIITVEAKDHGPVSLSSSARVIVHVQDGNNHQPVITGHSGTGMVKEGESGISPIQIHVTDKDTQNSPAWSVKYMLHGEISAFFQVDTDPATNDGILTLVKPLDFEDGAERTISVSVENEETFFSCEVTKKTASGLWTVVTSRDTETVRNTIHHQQFNITVEDTNDPPMFIIPVKDAVIVENEKIGRLVEQFTAVDPDTTYTSDFVYLIGHDPANWVRVDSKSGQIFLADTPDRESLHVVDNIYTVILLAVDNGDPPMTGTATLNIHVQDQNDNSPILNATAIGMCASDSTSEADISAHDLDGDPFGGPFTFKLLEDHKGWTLDPEHGVSVNLKKESVVFAGHHTLMLKILDKQGQFSIQNLSVTVCDCSLQTSCLQRRTSGIATARGAVAIIFLALFLLLGVLLLALYISCGTERHMIEVEHVPAHSLLPSNTEMPGIDCKVPTTQVVEDQGQIRQNLNHTDSFLQYLNSNQQSYYDIYGDTLRYLHYGKYSEGHQGKNLYAAGGGFYHSLAALTHNELYYDQYLHKYSHQQSGFCQHQNRHYKEMMTTQNIDVAQLEFIIGDRVLLKSLLEARLSSIERPEEEQCDYEPREYTYEEDSETLPDLDPIPIPEPYFDPDELLDLGPSFFMLASICTAVPENC